MNITPASYCQRCRFYHGANQVVCGPHPYGPGSKTCSDYVPRASGLNQGQTIRNRCSSQKYPDWKFWQAFLVMGLGMLVAVLGSGCLAVWLITHPTALTTKTILKSEWVR